MEGAMPHLNTVKPIALTLFMVLALVLRSHEAKTQAIEALTVVGSCFWCVESIFSSVTSVI
jgi:peptide-methionine (S)-S-oxide reductase